MDIYSSIVLCFLIVYLFGRIYLTVVFFTIVGRSNSFIVRGTVHLSTISIIYLLMVTGENLQASLIVRVLIVLAENISNRKSSANWTNDCSVIFFSSVPNSFLLTF